MQLYINRKKPVVTYALAAANAGLFAANLLCVLIFKQPVLTIYGAKQNALILLFHQWWRLITPMFLHGWVEYPITWAAMDDALTHLLCNLAGLAALGTQCESLMGRWRFLLIYFASGFLGCCASLGLTDAMSVGASGAIFGLFGALLVFRKTHREVFRTAYGKVILFYLILNVVFGFVMPGVDNFGHFGGLVGGFLACSAVGFYKQRGWAAKQTLFVLAYFVLAAALIGIAFLRFLAL